MELFYCRDIASGATTLDPEESNHCVRVLRHRIGDTIHVVDGCGCLYHCSIIAADPKKTAFEVISVEEGWGSHPYRLHMAVAPPKNIDRFEWFAEKATEIGVDEITPLFGDYSERKVFKGERCERIIVSAAKQSHKAAVPQLHQACSVTDFIAAHADSEDLKLICYCDEVESLGCVKRPITEVLARERSDGSAAVGGPNAVAAAGDAAGAAAGTAAGTAAGAERGIIVMIGPEGDFSRSEIAAATASGWQPVALGDSRLRIETAALAATAAVYFSKQ